MTQSVLKTMGSCLSNHAEEKELNKEASTNVTSETEEHLNPTPDEHNYDLSDIDNDDNMTRMNEKESTPKEDQMVDTVIQDVDIDNGGILLSDEWKLRKFHSTLYDYDLIGFMDDNIRNDYIVIDVRDPNLDYPGGHIKGGINIYHQDFINKLPQLINKYNMKSKIIIHCMYSQSRGPLCAKYYCLAIESLLKCYNNNNKNHLIFEQCIKQNQDFEILKTINLDDTLFDNLLNQQIFVLKNGFRGFVNKFRDNDKYITDFDLKHWQYENIGGAKELYHKNDW